MSVYKYNSIRYNGGIDISNSVNIPAAVVPESAPKAASEQKKVPTSLPNRKILPKKRARKFSGARRLLRLPKTSLKSVKASLPRLGNNISSRENRL